MAKSRVYLQSWVSRQFLPTDYTKQLNEHPTEVPTFIKMKGKKTHNTNDAINLKVFSD